MVQPRIEHLKQKLLAGKCMNMSLAENRTKELWSAFMPLKKFILNQIGQQLYSVQIYDGSYFDNFSPSRQIEKWAAVEISIIENLPEGIQILTIPPGLYAVFLHKGSSADPSTFEYIFREWLPNSVYEPDSRPHFEILGEKYKNADAGSEEEIWIPVKEKNAG